MTHKREIVERMVENKKDEDRHHTSLRSVSKGSDGAEEVTQS
jgi:hypothetical protein